MGIVSKPRVTMFWSTDSFFWAGYEQKDISAITKILAFPKQSRSSVHL